jgi:hypothetical protein
VGDEVAASTDIAHAGLVAARAGARGLAPHRSPRPMDVIQSPVLDDGLIGEALIGEALIGEALLRPGGHVAPVLSVPELREGVASLVERRRPRFAPLGPSPD